MAGRAALSPGRALKPSPTLRQAAGSPGQTASPLQTPPSSAVPGHRSGAGPPKAFVAWQDQELGLPPDIPKAGGRRLSIALADASAVATRLSTRATIGPAIETVKKPVEDVEQMNIDDLLEPGQSPRWQLLLCIFLFTIGPGVVLTVRGFLEREECLDTQAACTDRCYSIYGTQSFEFSSQYLPRGTCVGECTSTGGECLAIADSAIMGGLSLLGGFCCSIVLFQLLSAIQKKNAAEGADSAAGGDKPRAAFMEPVPTEEEKRKELLARPWWHFWGQSQEPFRLREAHCDTCDVKVLVDNRWISCAGSAMEGSVCPRCRTVIVGLL